MKEIISLLIPVLSIVMGYVIKKGNNPNLLKFQDYWYLFVIGGIFLFIYRLYKIIG